MHFEPIAIVGRSCVLPSAHTPDAFWKHIEQGHNLLSSAPSDRWGMPRTLSIGSVDHSIDRSWSDAGGYVTHFEQHFDPTGFALPSSLVQALDPVFRWSLHGVREALRDASINDTTEAGLVLGNLSFPSASLSRFSEDVWLSALGPSFASLRTAASGGRGRPDARNRFSSGLPALLTARALQLHKGAFALDAACASSLYAIKLACDKLHDRSADVMIAGAVNCADDLFIHVGFCALSAMSRSGQSRPFHRDADGLVPAEGAAFVTLMRLDDALRSGRRILGVLRGIGLSNDGRGRGLLAPSEEGQRRAMQQAFATANLDPTDLSLLECHATGTTVGDATEVQSSVAIFRDHQDLPIGSLKSNVGHLVTAAGTAALLKVLGAMEHGIRPPTLHTEAPISALQNTPFRLLTKAEPWNGRRIAGISAFGFGGNNAHLLVEAWEGSRERLHRVPETIAAKPKGPIAVTRLYAFHGNGEGDERALLQTLLDSSRPTDRKSVPTSEGVRFPPRDLQQTLAQQLLLLETARRATHNHPLPRERSGVFIGMGCDPEVARYGARWRVASWAQGQPGVDDAWIATARDGFVPKLEAAGVVGTMPNIPANRVGSQLDAAGPGFTVSSEEASGLHALFIALRALRAQELDVALVGAVDLSCEPVHREALRALGVTATTGDASVVLVLERLEDARKAERPVLAVFDESIDETHFTIGDGSSALNPERVFGRAHAASGLLSLASAIAFLRAGTLPPDVHCDTAPEERSARIRCQMIESGAIEVVVRAGDVSTQATIAPFSARTMLETPGHPKEPSMPSLKQTVQRMAPAPWLPPVLNGHEPTPLLFVAPTPSAPPVPVTTTHEEVIPTVVYATHEATSSMEFVLQNLSQFHEQLGAVHRSFLEAQSNAHQHFLALQDQTSRALLQALGQTPVVVERAVIDVPAPAIAPVREVVAVPPPVVVEAPKPTFVEVVPAPKAVAKETRKFPGPAFDRKQLEVLASGAISSVFGPRFVFQDGFHRQVRMPEPPLLLADRVLGIDAEPCSMGTGKLWTETDVHRDSWYLTPEGRMPAGIMIEAGQADLLLISWLGIDQHNRSERVYRLLGCELTYHDQLPKPGETLRYEIHVDGHAQQGDVRLFFFHYDCTVNGSKRLSVRHGQAGFFTDEELANSGGVLWSPSEEKLEENPRLDPPAVAIEKKSFTHEELQAFSLGRLYECFGKGFEFAQTHVRTPRTCDGKMFLPHRVTDFDPKGGPWERGYLRAEQDLRETDWFLEGHFKNDPCMPGTLMFEGCLQTMAFYLSAMGFTLLHDGWRFEPVTEEKYLMRCRGQAIPSSRSLVYEVFVREVHSGPLPTLFADLLCTVDGRKAFHARRVGVRLVPDWPLAHWEHLRPRAEQETGAFVPLAQLGGLQGYTEPKPVAVIDGFPFDYHSLMACAWGRPSEAFGPFYKPFDGTRKVARLPGPPYHFMSRVTHADPPIGSMKTGGTVAIEYDVPERVWYFEQNGYPTMPFCVLMEAALQPCGWLASYVGSALTTDIDLLFRNLDGTGTLHEDILPGAGPLLTKVKITNISQSGGMIIESFEVECLLQGRRVYDMKTVFGFFPKEAFENQVGLPVSATERERFQREANTDIELVSRPAKYFDSYPKLTAPMLQMLHRITGFWRNEGRAGLGYLRAERAVAPTDWYFKAHFFQDPVQPGSLGVEAFVQLLQWYMLETGLGAELPYARFEPIRLGKPVTWKYRGQVVPKNKLLQVEMEITEVGTDERGAYAVCDAWLWVDGKRIYSAKNLGMRVVAGTPPQPRKGDDAPIETTLDLEKDAWLGAHRPTWTIASLPMLSMADALAAQAERSSGQTAVELTDVAAHRWLTVTDAVRTQTRVLSRDGDALRVQLSAWREASTPSLSRFEPVAEGTVRVGALRPEQAPKPWSAFTDVAPLPDPYASGQLFHGEAFQCIDAWRCDARGASALLHVERCTVPRGALHQGILDALTHVIPHDELSLWSEKISNEFVAYPHRIAHLRRYGVIPSEGTLRVEARFAGFANDERFPIIDVQLIDREQVLVELRLVEILLPKGPLGSAPRAARRAFLEGKFARDVALSSVEDNATVLREEDVHGSDWLPGNINAIYALSNTERSKRTEAIAIKEHVARHAYVTPRSVSVFETPYLHGVAAMRPLRAHPVQCEHVGNRVFVRSSGVPQQELTRIRDWWHDWFGIGHWPVEDLYYGLIERFVGDVVLTDPQAFANVYGRPCLYLGNHQVGVESLLFSVLAGALSGVPVRTVAKAEHRTSWLGRLIELSFRYPEAKDPGVITFFDREDREALLEILQELATDFSSGKRGAMVHVEGTRGVTCRTPVQKMSSAFIDLALSVQAPIVPVRFIGGLPVEPLETRLEFPVQFGRQDYWIGRPILPEELASLPLKDRKQFVIAAINGLGPSNEHEHPHSGDPVFAERVQRWSEQTGATIEHATLFETLRGCKAPTEQTQRLLDGATKEVFSPGNSPVDRWLAELASRLFGSKGPRVE